MRKDTLKRSQCWKTFSMGQGEATRKKVKQSIKVFISVRFFLFSCDCYCRAWSVFSSHFTISIYFGFFFCLWEKSIFYFFHSLTLVRGDHFLKLTKKLPFHFLLLCACIIFVFLPSFLLLLFRRYQSRHNDFYFFLSQYARPFCSNFTSPRPEQQCLRNSQLRWMRKTISFRLCH